MCHIAQVTLLALIGPYPNRVISSTANPITRFDSEIAWNTRMYVKFVKNNKDNKKVAYK